MRVESNTPRARGNAKFILYPLSLVREQIPDRDAIRHWHYRKSDETRVILISRVQRSLRFTSRRIERVPAPKLCC